ncbi:MAG: hypothetical protein EBR82_04525 [Caulobacteraceae bacterium]|nr:hypothetical protein [Caulobacteraceae bacterium]
MTENPAPAGPRKSGPRLMLDAVLFVGIALVFVWAGLGRLAAGEIDLRRGGIIRLADDPVLFWCGLGVHVAIVLTCLWLASRAGRDFYLQRREVQP